MKIGGDISIISMGPPKTAEFLAGLTRLGAERAILLTDKAFAGADTLATAYTLSLALKKLKPDLIICGRQTLEGDTAQVGPMLSVKMGCSLITNVTEIHAEWKKIVCKTRSGKSESAAYPALITVERISTLRLPSIRSKMKEVEIYSAAHLAADEKKCGLSSSPTRVIKTYENDSGKRKCEFIKIQDLPKIIDSALKKQLYQDEIASCKSSLKRVFTVGDAPLQMAKTVSDDVSVIKSDDYKEICEIIKSEAPSALLFASDDSSKATAAKVAASLNLGLCADCTRLEGENGELIMYRPALSGSIIAKIKSLTRPALATVRTPDDKRQNIIVSVGYGAKDCLDKVKLFAKKINAELGASRKMVDNGYMSYSAQVGLTGKTVSPPLFIAVGISGAVHHAVGFDRSGTVIAINSNKSAKIFDYADYGIVADLNEIDFL